jgi:hypothetical protein
MGSQYNKVIKRRRRQRYLKRRLTNTKTAKAAKAAKPAAAAPPA